ncbi:MAG: hypothetical protein ACPLRM_00860, partial [Anaerolineae bacterium]
KKTVYAQVKDAAGNVSQTVSREVNYFLVDVQAPRVEVTVNGGSKVTTSRDVSLEVVAEDDLTPADQLMMRFSTDFVNWSVWERYAPLTRYTLPSGEGQKLIAVQVKDGSGNIGTGYGIITLVTSGGDAQYVPQVVSSGSGTVGQMSLNGQQVEVRFVNSPCVTVTLADTVGQVQFSLDNLKWLPAEPAQPVKTVTLPDWDGIKTVYVKLETGAIYFVRFVLDRVAPEVDAEWLGGASVTNNGAATIWMTARDNVSPQSALQYSIDGGATWKPFQMEVPVVLSGKGYRTVYLMVKDQAGNVTVKRLGIFN